jgi:hypothetical protein
MEAVMNPKLNKSMTIDEYHQQTDYLSKSMLSELADCPARFKYKYIDGNDKQQTASMRLGNAVHVLALEPEIWKDNYHILPETYFNDKGEEKPFRADPRMQAYKDEMEKAGDRIVLKRDEYERVEQMAESLTRNQFALALLKAEGYPEASIFWQEDSTPLRCRPDFMRNDGLIVDLKTCRSAKPSFFQKDAWNMHYDVSVALTARGYNALYEQQPDNYVFLCIETEPPYIVEAYETHKPMDDFTGLSYQEIGEMRLTNLLNDYRECVANDHWPGYVGKISTMKAPRWAVNQLMEGETDE